MTDITFTTLELRVLVMRALAGIDENRRHRKALADLAPLLTAKTLANLDEVDTAYHGLIAKANAIHASQSTEPLFTL